MPTIPPELASSAWADAIVRDVLDMRVGIEYGEDYTDPASDVWLGYLQLGPEEQS